MTTKKDDKDDLLRLMAALLIKPPSTVPMPKKASVARTLMANGVISPFPAINGPSFSGLWMNQPGAYDMDFARNGYIQPGSFNSLLTDLKAGANQNTYYGPRSKKP